MALQRAVVIDRDPNLLSRLTAELGRAGYAVETLNSTTGLTPDLLALSEPNLVVLDAGLPDLSLPAVLVLFRSLKSRLQVRLMVVGVGAAAEASKLGADLMISREKLLREGAAALGIISSAPESLDVRKLIDEVLGRKGSNSSEVAAKQPKYEVRLDLFSESQLYVVKKGEQPGIFVGASNSPAVGSSIDLEVDLFGRNKILLKGQVAWQRNRSVFWGNMPSGFGVKLLELKDTEKAALQKFVEAREPLIWTK